MDRSMTEFVAGVAVVFIVALLLMAFALDAGVRL